MSRETDREILDKISSHIGDEKLVLLAGEMVYNARNDGYGESLTINLAGTMINYVLFRLMKEGKIALVTRDK